MDQKAVIEECRNSECFKSECAYAALGNYEVVPEPRLYKVLEDDLVRVVFPTTVTEIEEGTVIAITCLYDLKKKVNIYAHTICAGPGVNVLLRTIHAPLSQAKPQPEPEGDRQILRFVAWKEAAWVKFLNDDLELGTKEGDTCCEK